MKTKTKQKAFILRDWEVRAMLAEDGTLTELRRVCNPQIEDVRNATHDSHGIYFEYKVSGRWIVDDDFIHEYSPYGTIGDEFWVRETY